MLEIAEEIISHLPARIQTKYFMLKTAVIKKSVEETGQEKAQREKLSAELGQSLATMPPPDGLISTVPPPDMVETKPDVQQQEAPEMPELCSIGVGPDVTDTLETRDDSVQTDTP